MMASPERATNLPLPVESRLSPSSSKNDRESRNSSPKIRDRVKNSSEKGSSKKDWDEKGTETKKRKLDSEDSKDEELRQKRLDIRESGKVQFLDKNFLTHLSEMHPTSALHELCTKLNWAPPNLVLSFECGPPMMRQYIFKATVNGQTFQPAVAVDNKKDAKAKAAWAALQEMGFVKKDPANPI